MKNPSMSFPKKGSRQMLCLTLHILSIPYTKAIVYHIPGFCKAPVLPWLHHKGDMDPIGRKQPLIPKKWHSA